MNTFIIILAIITAFFIGAIAGGFVMFVFMRIMNNSNFFSDEDYREKVNEMRSRKI